MAERSGETSPVDSLRFPEDVTEALPRAHGGPPLRGRLKAVPEDFVVEELGTCAPEGEGEHLLLRVRKRGLNTLEVARRLAVAAGVPLRAVGFAGLKDRHALTTQCFSIHLPRGESPDWSGLAGAELQIEAVGRQRRKLRRGALRGNRFRIRLTELQGEREAADERLEALAAHGFPNYFGAQRFGRGASNLIRAQAWFLGRLRRPPPEQSRMLVSAARAYLFNLVLAERVMRGDWERLLPGEVAQREQDGHQLLVRHLEARARDLLRKGALHPTGPLAGRGGHCLAPEDEVAALETALLAAPPFDHWVAQLRRRGVNADRRPLRVLPRDLEWEWGQGQLMLGFALPAGCYATSLVRELLTGAGSP